MTRLRAWKMACAVFALCAVTAIVSHAQTFTVLATFDGKDGAGPQLGSLIQGLDGNFYGTPSQGGGGRQNDDGTIFEITPTGTVTTIHVFQGTDGTYPTGLVLATDGNMYGTTGAGGKYHDSGTIFQLTGGGAFKSLFSFHGINGDLIYGTPAQGVNGDIYGTTLGGGDNDAGTVYRGSPNRKIQTLHSFDTTDGAYPWAGLILGSDGNFYGTTPYGGTGIGNCVVSGGPGCGTVFRITPSGKFTTVHNFDGTDGSGPFARLVQGSDGNFYGTTAGTNDGSIFKMTRTGVVTTLHNFDGADGSAPWGALIQASDGNFYGTTYTGGANGYGTIFKISPQGILTTLYDFCPQGPPCADGAGPQVGLLQGTDGALYGMTRSGGDDDGTVYSLDVGIGSFVAFVGGYGKVGQSSSILGQVFTGTTAVSFRGISASFTVVSDTFIKATVPAGATTGYVTVTTPSGTLTSNVPFHVIP